MNRKLIVIISLLFLSLSILPLKAITGVTEASDGYPVHNLSTGLNYTTIQEAINANETHDGHTILVDVGKYCEHVNITKSVIFLGEDRNATVIDGNGTGIVVQISADNVTIANFTVRNGGHNSSWLDSCVYGNYHNNILMENNTVMNATNGIVFYGFSNSTVRHNLVTEFGLMGLHLDGGSANCTIANNTVTNCLEGMELEGSARNWIEENQFMNNNLSVFFNGCPGPNAFKKNNMTSDWYNLMVWGSAIGAFEQDIDTSNTVNKKTVTYISNSNNLLVDPSIYPNLGYLAIVNCSNLTIRNADLSFNRDGLLIAQSTNCHIENLTIGGNQGPLLYGGLTFFKSNGSLIVGSEINNNSVGICLYQSNDNNFYHNSFLDVSKPVISDFSSPFSAPSGLSTLSMNVWDNGFEGNYWSNYNGTDSFSGPYQNETGSDGIGDSPYRVNGDPKTPPELVQFDHYPLMGMFNNYNVTYYTSNYVQHFCNVTVISNSTISGFAVPFWIEHPEVKFMTFNVTGIQGSVGFCRITIPTAMMNDTYHVTVNGTEVPYNLLPCSNANYSYLYFTYKHSTEQVVIIPEFPSFLILSLLMISTLVAIMVFRRKHNVQTQCPI